jgi:phosphoglycolate phosphatase
LDPADVVVIGDTPHDVDCGHALGARVVAVTTGGATRAELEAHRPARVLDSLREITAEALCA